MSSLDTATDEAYLNRSFERFEKYAVPSMRNQTCKNFIWLVLFSKDTPPVYVDRIIRGGYCEQLKPLFLTDEETHNFRAYIIDYIRENYGFTSWITTRFDNDDAIRFDYIEKIQKCYDKNKGEYAISFSDGYQYDAGKNVLSKYHFPNNHFTTFVTDLRDKTIYDFGHINLVNQNRMIYLDEGIAMWVEVIHGNNVYNRMGTINPFNYIKFKNLNEEFGIDVKVQRSILELIWFYFYFAIRKAWNKRDRMWIYFCRKLHIKYKDNRTDR